ncbi:MAG TPA: radical SAM protein [Candidatus Nitrosotenuis sp.]|nr:radical SAM protein [Candidatus Nitrosotenuis sp.]
MNAVAPQVPPSRLSDSTILTRAEGLYMSRRGDRVLLIEPESASWYVLEPAYWPIFMRIQRPIPLAHLISSFPQVRPEVVRSVVANLWYLGMLRADGRPYHDLSNLWPAPSHQGPAFLAVHIAEGCNFRCSYCYNSSMPFKGKRMPLELAHRIVDKAVTEIRSPHLTFDFIGGEPLLAFEEILGLIRYAREQGRRHGKAVAFAVQTNGALLTEERAIQLRDLNVGVGVSIDGPRELHDEYRIDLGGAGTHAKVLENLLRARDLGLRVSPLAVIYRADSYVPVLEYFLSMGFESMRFNYANYLGRAKYNLTFAPERAEAYATAFLQMVDRAREHTRQSGRPLLIHDLCFMIRNVAAKKRDYMCMRSPCGLGDSIVSFSVDGNVYACEEYEENTKGKFLLGTLEELNLGNLMEVHQKLRALKQRKVENIPKCSRCHLRYICGGGCTHKALAYFGELLREDPMCGFYMRVYEELMWKIWDDPELVATLGGPFPC